MRGFIVLGSFWLASSCLAEIQRTIIADFDNERPLSGWEFSRDTGFAGTSGSLTVGRGHSGQGAVLAYEFPCATGTRCGGAVAAVLKLPKPLGVKRDSALSLWIRAAADVNLTLLVTNQRGAVYRYPFEVITLENAGGDWRQVSVPLAAKSRGYFDESHTGAPKGRITAIGILATARYPLAMHGSVAFDDLSLLKSSDQTFNLSADAPIVPAPPGSAGLAPRLGINVHSLGDTRALDLARDAGFHLVRADLLWRLVERNGAYRFFGYDRLLNSLETRGMNALWILDYGHPQHGGDRPRTPEDLAAFVRYVEAAAAHFKGRNVRYEIWNEPNTDRFWPPAPNAAEYAVLLRESAAAIRRTDPDARIASGGLATIDLPFLESVIATGAANELNAVAIHPYRKTGPETLAAELPLLRDLVRRTLGSRVEIWDTEWGYASYDYFSKNLRGDGHSAPGRERQAVLTSREMLTVRALGLPVAVWYDLRDDGEDGRNPEHNYGLLDSKDLEKPAMTALRTLARIAQGRTFAGMASGVPDGLHAMRLDGNADRVYVVWNEQPDASITVRFPGGLGISMASYAGEPLKPRINSDGSTQIALTETQGPIYVTLHQHI